MMDQMDDTETSRKSAATRKRRSSILKSQRPPRTPFSELEFNIATPTDTTKSRRVSFSRKTGVAEFATNEATTTWKNFYEEHNKSLESSNNDSGIKQSQQTVAHLGKSIFDQQFEVEALDFGNTINPMSHQVNSSISHVNFTLLDNTCGDKTLAPSQKKNELSALTVNQSMFFGDDLLAPVMSENTGHIDINLSAVNSIRGEIMDDLDEIQRDLQRSHSSSNVVCHGPFIGNVSEYIEVDLNMTNVAIRNDDDMSITDTIHSPKVQEISKNTTQIQKDELNNDWVADKENIVINPYVAPKESINFAFNEDPNKVLVFDGKRLTITKSSDVVPTAHNDFHKTLLPNQEQCARKSIVYDDDAAEISMTQAIPQNIILSNRADKTRSIFDDGANNVSMTQTIPSSIIASEEPTLEKRNTVFDDVNNIIILATKNNSDKHKTIVYDYDMGNISVTQTLPANIILNKNVEAAVKTDNTTAFDSIDIPKAVPSDLCKENAEKQRTIVFENDTGDISMTQAIPANIIIPAEAKRKTIIFEDNLADLSVTQAVSTNVIQEIAKEKRNTIVYDYGEGEVSITQAIPSVILGNLVDGTNKRRTIVYDCNNGDISMTQAVPTNLLVELSNTKQDDKTSQKTNVIQEIAKEKRNTIVCDNSEGEVSITQAIPSVILGNLVDGTNKRRRIVYDCNNGDISMTQAVPTNLLVELSNTKQDDKTSQKTNVIQEIAKEKRNTIVYDYGEGEVSITQAIPSVILGNLVDGTNKRRTIVYDCNNGDISMTQAVPTNLLVELSNTKQDDKTSQKTNVIQEIANEKRKTIVCDNSDGEVSITQAIPSVILGNLVDGTNKRRTIVYDCNNGDISMTQAVPTNLLVELSNTKQDDKTSQKTNVIQEIAKEKRNTIVCDNSEGEVSITQAIPSVILGNFVDGTNKRRTIVYDCNNGDVSMTQAVPKNLLVELSNTKHDDQTSHRTNVIQDIAKEKRNTIVFDNGEGEVSITQAIPSVILGNLVDGTNKRRTIVYDSNNGDVTMTQAVPTNLLEELSNSKQDNETSQRKTMEDNDMGDILITQAIPSNLLLPNERRKTIVYEDDACDISVTQSIPTNIISAYQTTVVQINNLIDESTLKPDKNPVKDTNYVHLNSINEINNDINHQVVPVTTNASMIEAKTIRSEEIDMKERVKGPTSETNNIVIINESVQLPKNESLIEENILADGKHNSAKPILPELAFLQNKLDKSVIDKSISDEFYQETKEVINHVFGLQYIYQMTKNNSSKKFDTLSEQDDTPSNEGDNSEENVDPTGVADSGQQTELESIISDDHVTSHGFDKKPNKNLLHKLLDMSNTSLDLTTDKSASANMSYCSNMSNPSVHTRESFILITKDNVADIDSDVLYDKNSTGNKKEDAIIEDAILDDTEHKIDKSDINSTLTATADTTKDLLNLLTEYTTGSIEQSEITAAVVNMVQSDTLEPIKSCLSLKRGQKSDTSKKSCTSLKRVSIANSKEEILSNKSMSQTILQTTRKGLVDTVDAEDKATNTLDESIPQKQGRCNDVVKKLHFEDESENDSMSTDTNISPLKKTAFGESTYLAEQKSRVIPSYLKDVSDEVKQLMLDLMKPNDDVFPAEVPVNLPATRSEQLQVNLITSSQIDINPSDLSCTGACSINDCVSDSLTSSAVFLRNKSISQVQLCSEPIRMLSDCNQTDSYKDSDIDDVESQQGKYQEEKSTNKVNTNASDSVLYFDENNPLNNVLLPPEAMFNSKCKCKKNNNAGLRTVFHENDVSNDHSVTGQNLKFDVDMYHTALQSGDASLEKLDHNNCSRCQLNDLNSPDKFSNVKDTEANTVIAMKVNKELLANSSSLTLIEDATTRLNTDESSSKASIQSDDLKSVNEIKRDSDEDEIDKTSKAQKRFYSPCFTHASEKKLENVVETPEPISKIQKLSTSPIYNISYNAESKNSKSKKKHKKSKKRSITVQQLITQFDKYDDLNNIKSTDSASSLASETCVPVALTSDDFGTEYIMKLNDSKERVPLLEEYPAEDDSDVNMIDTISKLSLMVKHECEWGPVTADTWSFLLFHSRLRMCVRLACTNGDSCDARVRRDTKVLDISVEKVNEKDNNQISSLCVDLALKAMRLYISREYKDAESVVLLLRRCGTVGRIVQRWGQAMHSTMLHLAFTVHNNEVIKFHVANVQSRSVWEVTMHIIMNSRSTVPFPMVDDVRMTSIVGFKPKVIEGNMRRYIQNVPADWGNVPRTIWRIFKYLTNKTVVDEFLVGLSA